jgi:hypothetical protein
MALVRTHRPGRDAPLVCGECCKEKAEIVIDQFPTTAEHVCLCHRCASDTLAKHPRLLASAVVTLILKSQRTL